MAAKRAIAKKPFCLSCKEPLIESSAEGLWLHPASDVCTVKVTDEVGLSVDEQYEVEGGVVYAIEKSNTGFVVLPEEPPPDMIMLPGVPTPFEQAIGELFTDYGLPRLGGASGDLGWSSFATFQRCPYLWKRRYIDGYRETGEDEPEPFALVVGSLIHTFAAVYYQRMITPEYPLTPKLVYDELFQRGVNSDALIESERVWSAYQLHYQYDYLKPLALELHAADPRTSESCRFDMIAEVVEDLPGFAKGTVIVEHKCLRGDALIKNYETGRLERVIDLFTHGIAPLVRGININTLKLEEQRAEVPVPDSIKDIYEVILESGRSVPCSENHPFLTAAGWKAARELSKGSWVATPLTVGGGTQPIETVPDSTVLFLGYMLGDGCWSSGITFSQNDGAVFDGFVQICQDMGLSDQPDGYREQRFQKTGRKNSRASAVRFPTRKGTPVRELLMDWGVYGSRAHEKKVPTAFMSLSDRQTGLLLGGLWDTDGCITICQQRSAGMRVDARFVSMSKALASQNRDLLLRLGVPAWVRKNIGVIDGETVESYMTTIITRKGKRRFLELIKTGVIPTIRLIHKVEEALATLSHAEDDLIPVELLVDVASAGLATDDFRVLTRLLAKQRIQPTSAVEASTLRGWMARAAKPHVLAKIVDAELRWEQVASIEKVGRERTYNITVPGLENFIVNDVITHNTTSMFSDTALTGWVNDGEVIGQIMLYNRLKLYKRFGPLQGVIVNILGKQKKAPQFHRTFVSPNRWQTSQHAKDLQSWQALKKLYISSNHFPRARFNCVHRYGKCSQWEHCATGEG